MSSDKIALLLNKITSLESKISNLADKIDIIYSSKIKSNIELSKDRLEELIREHRSISAVARILGCNRQTVRNRIDSYKIDFYSSHSNGYVLNENYFENIDTEDKAYILGLLAADGWVTERNIHIALQDRDAKILDVIRKALNSNAPIKIKTRENDSWGRRPLHHVTFGSVKMVKDLAKYGIVPNKSKVGKYPKIPKSLEQHYIRGLWDGDGHINEWQFSVLGTNHVLHGVQNSIISHTGIHLDSSPVRGYPRIIGYRRDSKVLHWMYKDATIFLDRKHKYYEDFYINRAPRPRNGKHPKL